MSESNRNRRSANRLTNRTAAVCVASALFVLTITSDAGITRTGGQYGRIEALGSIFVNGREIGTSTAVIVIDGHPGTESDLRVGQIVIVNGVQNDELLPTGITRTGDAAKVIVSDVVDGPITAVDSGSDHVTVLGQPVIVDETTIIDLLSGAESTEDLTVGDEVEVHGFPMADGSVRATRIADRTAGSEFEVTGQAAEVTEQRFVLNELSVRYSPEALAGASLNNGDLVEVKGSTIGVSGELTAARIELLGPINGEPGDAGEVEGLITRFGSLSDFEIGRVRVTTTVETAYDGGGPANLDNDSNVVVRGDYDDSGILIANSVTLRGATVRIHAQVYGADENTLTLLNIPVTGDVGTVFDDASSLKLESMSFGDIYPGDTVEFRSVKDPASVGSIVAQRIRRVDSLDDTILQGFVTSPGNPAFELQGVRIDTNEQTQFRNLRNEKITATAFFKLVTEGSLVKASGTQTSNRSITATEVGLEID